MTVFFSIIVPVWNGGDGFRRCLGALEQSLFQDWELIVVDDGSTDGSANWAGQAGAQVLATQGQMGPAFARNLGATVARGQYLFFVDADCAVHGDTLQKAADILGANPALEALFGSYNDAPAATNFVSQFRWLQHHFVHQGSGENAGTFWTGCGAIKRTTFQQLGGFNAEKYPRPAIEDIELGVRLKQAGGQIRLAKEVQVKHLKRLTLGQMIRGDIFDRGVPWLQLMWEVGKMPADLNLRWQNRLSVVLVWLGMPAFFIHPLLTLPIIFALITINAPFYQFLYQKRGFSFTIRAMFLHWGQYFYSALAFPIAIQKSKSIQNLKSKIQNLINTD